MCGTMCYASWIMCVISKKEIGVVKYFISRYFLKLPQILSPKLTDSIRHSFTSWSKVGVWLRRLFYLFPRFQIVVVYVTSRVALRPFGGLFGFAKCVGALKDDDTARCCLGLGRFRPRGGLVGPWSQSWHSPSRTLKLLAIATLPCTNKHNNQIHTITSNENKIKPLTKLK